jgi:Na+-transporting NADH:ubiquinone oxidoreductase subunit NqrF
MKNEMTGKMLVAMVAGLGMSDINMLNADSDVVVEDLNKRVDARQKKFFIAYGIGEASNMLYQVATQTGNDSWTLGIDIRAYTRAEVFNTKQEANDRIKELILAEPLEEDGWLGAIDGALLWNVIKEQDVKDFDEEGNPIWSRDMFGSFL